MQTTFTFYDLDVMCIDGPLGGQCYAITSYMHPQYLGLGRIPYRPLQGDSGEWFYEYAADLDEAAGSHET